MTENKTRTEKMDVAVWSFIAKKAQQENSENMFDMVSNSVHNMYDILAAIEGVEVNHDVISDYICQAWNAAWEAKCKICIEPSRCGDCEYFSPEGESHEQN